MKDQSHNQDRTPSHEEEKAANDFVHRMLDWTQRLVRIDEHDGNHMGSGLLVQRDDRYFLLTACHVVQEGKWAIESNWVVDDKALSFGVTDPQVTYSKSEDFAWSELDMRRIAKQIQSDEKLKDKKVELNVYRGPLDAPLDRKMSYGFATWKAAEFVEGPRWLVRDPVFELAMEYVGVEPETKLLAFIPNHGHKGHKHYKGCSGAPIAGVDGRIVALVVRGHPKENPTAILGVPLHDKESMLGDRPST